MPPARPDVEYEDVWFRGEHGERPTLTKKVKGTQYPATDIEDRRLFVNTHFATEDEAWASALSEASAGVRLSSGDYRNAQRRLEEATKQLAEDTAKFVDLKEADEQRRRAR